VQDFLAAVCAGMLYLQQGGVQCGFGPFKTKKEGRHLDLWKKGKQKKEAIFPSLPSALLHPQSQINSLLPPATNNNNNFQHNTLQQLHQINHG
jgi:hypothetical protein